MKEKELNTIISNSFKKVLFGHKIADPMGGMGSQNPFDGIAVAFKKNIYFESKIVKPISAMNFNSIEAHQEENLLKIKKETPESLCLILLGAFEPRKYFYLFAFDIFLIGFLKSKEKKSILKKELLTLVENKMYIPILINNGKYFVDFKDTFLNKIITKEYWEKTFYAEHP